jgi:hypothetical protein
MANDFGLEIRNLAGNLELSKTSVVAKMFQEITLDLQETENDTISWHQVMSFDLFGIPIFKTGIDHVRTVPYYYAIKKIPEIVSGHGWGAFGMAADVSLKFSPGELKVRRKTAGPVTIQLMRFA